MNVYFKDVLLLNSYKENGFRKIDRDIGSENDRFNIEDADVNFQVFHHRLGYFGDHVCKYSR